MAEIHLRKGESIEEALKRFRKKCNAEKIIQIYKNKQFFYKPSAKKKNKRKASVNRKY